MKSQRGLTLRKARKGRRGLTLLEVLVSVILLATGLLGALEVVAHCAVTTAAVEDRARGLMFVRSKMDEILKEPVLQTGSDRGEGVDTSTDYDWQATIEPSSHPGLYVIMLTARHRKSGSTVTLTALRRPDIQTPVQGETSTTQPQTGSDPAGGDPAGGAGGAPM